MSMDLNERITEAAWREVREGDLLEGLEHGWCLQAVRLIVEDALGWPPKRFYREFGVERTTQGGSDRTDWSWWAADIEASMKKLDLAVPADERQPGDLVFRYLASKPYGHIALLVRRDLLIELVSPIYRPGSFSRGEVCLTPYGSWRPTLIARLRMRE